MAVVASSLHGWLLDHRNLSQLEVRQWDSNSKPPAVPEEPTEQMPNDRVQNETFAKKCGNICTGQSSNESDSETSYGKEKTVQGVDRLQVGSRRWKLKEDLFNIITTFQMDSQFCANANSEATEKVSTRKRKRKRKESLNEGEELAARFHLQVQEHILQGYKTILQAATQTEYIKNIPALDTPLDNNKVARLAAVALSEDIFASHCWETQGSDVILDEYCIGFDNSDKKQVEDVCNRVCRNSHNTSVVLTVESQRYIVPANSTFIMSDLAGFKKISSGLGKYDLIVMDPPWHNKSVKRKKMYYSLQNEELLDMPLLQLMKPGCLVVVWVTNRCKHINFVKKQLFPKNNIEYMATWFWLKVSKTGEMVYDINSEHKKPYETLIIGKYRDPHEVHQTDHGVEENKVLISVPCSLHSKKLPLSEILRDYLPAIPSCLELFARNLTANWMSWGNEVLLHQHVDFYEEVT